MFSTPARKAAGVVAGAGWGAAAVSLAQLELTPDQVAQPHLLGRLLVSVVVAAVCSLGLVLRVRNDCLDRAFELGYRAGMHDGARWGRGAGQVVVTMPRPRTTTTTLN